MDNEDNFTPYAIIPKPQNFSTGVGPIFATGYIDPQNKNLGGRLEYSNEDIVAGINKDLFNPVGIDVSLGNTRANLDKYGYDVTTSIPGIPGEVGYNSRSKTPYYQYNNGPLNLEVTPKDIQAGINAGNFTASGSYSKEAGPALNASYRKLFENGMIDVNGNLTPQGYQLMLQGQYSF